ncbi:MAG TPA: hypothetical protein VHB47_04615 [Thermoanaerobaculia bacterium]|nr:hypothetical protein [Thermoanaerobaculia bacterium]
MSDDDPEARDPSAPVPPAPAPAPASAPVANDARGPESDTPQHVRDRLRSIAARLRDAAEDLGGEVMIEIPSRLGDHEGLLLALANELEQLVK